MPTPIEILLDPISLGVLALYAALVLWEALAPGRQLPKVKGWLPPLLGSAAFRHALRHRIGVAANTIETLADADRIDDSCRQVNTDCVSHQ